MSLKTDNYVRFFNDQIGEIQKDYNKTKAIPMKQLFREEKLVLALVDSVNPSNGHVVIKVKKRFAPRLKVMKNFTLVSKKASELLGPVNTWNISFDEFNRTPDFHVGLSDIFPMYFLKRNDPEYDYIGCSSVTLQMFSVLEKSLSQGKTIRALLFDPFPPTEYFSNLAHFTKLNSEDPYLSLEPKISYDDWHPEELAYNPDKPLGIVDSIYDALTKDSCCIMQGPPGTGKSFTIAHIVTRYMELGKNVCVTTMANKGLIELAKQPPLESYLNQGRVYKTRLGADEAKQVPGLQAADKSLVAPCGSLVLATNYILSGLYNPKRDPSLARPSFDLIVIEEASQAFLSTIVAFKQLGHDCLIVGDPVQLPPIVVGSEKVEYKLWKVQQQCDGLTAFALGTDIKSFRIITTFRLTPRSASQTSLFYGKSFRSVQKERVDFSEINSPFFPEEGGSIVTYSQSGTDGICSRSALEIMHHVVGLITEHYPEKEVAIITPFRDTVKLLQKEFYTDSQQLDITVETIDRIQGMTVDYSIVYFPMNNIGFALSENRFNVATSRSKSTTLIISDLDFNALSSVPLKSLTYIRNCNVVDLNSGIVIEHVVDYSHETLSLSSTKTNETGREKVAEIKAIEPVVISNEAASLKVLGKIDLSKFERKKVEIIEEKVNYYIIDTNVFVNCPDIISKIDKRYTVVLAAKVVDELDKLKITLSASDQKNVQDALRSINKQMTQRDIRMELADVTLLPPDFNKRSPDNMILTVALKYKGESNNPILLTSDNGLMVKAAGLKITCISLKDFLRERRH